MILYCGWLFEKRTNWQEHMPEPERDNRYGDEKWHGEELPRRWKKLEADASMHLTAGRVAEVVAYSSGDEPYYAGDAVGFVDLLIKLAKPEERLIVAGVGVSKSIRHTLYTYRMETGRPAPLWLWAMTTEGIPRYYALRSPDFHAIDISTLGGTREAKIPINRLSSSWGLPPPADERGWTHVAVAAAVKHIAMGMGIDERML